MIERGQEQTIYGMDEEMGTGLISLCDSVTGTEKS